MPLPNPMLRSLARTLLRPGQAVMCALRLPGKLALLTAVLVLPLAVLALAAVHQAHDDLDFGTGERAGVRVVQQLADAAFQTLALRAPTEGRADEPAAATQAALRQTLQALDAQVAARAGSTEGLPFALAEPWARVRQHLQALADGPWPAHPAEAAGRTDAAVDAMHALMHQVGQQSGLLFDPEPLSHFLMELAVERLLPLADAMARLGPPAAPPDAAAAATRRLRAGDLERLRTDFAMRLDSVRSTGGTVPPAWARADAAIQRLASLAGSPTAGPAADAALQAAAAEGARALQATGDHALAALDRLLLARAAAIRTRLAWQMGALGLGIAALLYLAACFRASFAEALRNLHGALAAMARGDLAHPVQVPGRDEVAEIGRLAETVAERLSGIVCEIRSSAMRLSQTGESVAASAAALAERSEEQATNLVQTSRTVGSLSEAVASNAEASNALDRTTRLLRSDAHQSGQSMEATVAAMHSLQAVSQRAGEAVDAINAIAFRTNLLALNAAVEAARAGESGRGFAVVAGEVRQLAQRSAEAAREVRSLLEGIGSEVAGSSQRLQSAGTALGTLLRGVEEVSNELRHIAERSSGQSQGLAEVAQSVGSLDALTRRNQAMVNESTLAALELMDRAGSLSGTVAAIKLRQGSADEARNLVERAHSLVQRLGLGPAMTAMREPGAGFVDRDLYVFITDGQGVYRLHTAAPAREGHRVHEAPGIDGDAFVRDAREAAQGSHWVDYTITNLTTGLPQRKTSYVVALDGDLVLGCGFYRHDVNASLALDQDQEAEAQPA